MFILENPSNKLYRLISQLSRLATLAGEGNYSFDSALTAVKVDEDFIIKGLQVPLKLNGKVTISQDTPLNLLNNSVKSHALSIINMETRDDDVVFKAYSEKYDISSSYCLVWDIGNKTNIGSPLLWALVKLFINGLKVDNLVTVNIFVYDSQISSQSQSSSQSLNPANKHYYPLPEAPDSSLNIKVNIIEGLKYNFIAKLMLQSKTHFYTGSKASSLICKLVTISDLNNVIASVPMLDYSVPENGWKCINATRTSTKFFQKIYYINLSHRTDRREHMERQLLKLGLSAGRINAVNGRALGWDPGFGIQSKFWNTGAVAYCLSYQNAVIDAIKNNYDQILVLDDDAVLSENFTEVLEEAFKSLPDEWHMLYLAANHSKESAPNEESCISPSLYRLRGSVGSHAIIINKPAFNTVLNFASTPYGPLDVFFSVYQQICPCYITYPGLASQLPGKSDIIDATVDYEKDWKIDYINHVPYRKISTEDLKKE